jgi:hypothetical protein
MACTLIGLDYDPHKDFQYLGKRSFGDVDNAVRYVMEQVPADRRALLMITSDTEPRTMHLADIERHYAKITGQ